MLQRIYPLLLFSDKAKDETWPTCLNCQKNGKCCPGPPARHTFKDLGPSLISSANTLQPNKTQSVVQGTFSILTMTSSGSSTNISTDPNRRYLTQVHEKFTPHGSVQLKFKISNRDSAHQRKLGGRSASTSTASLSPPHSPLLRQPSPSQHHELSRALVATINAGNIGLQMSVFGPFIQEVPARIGYNPALDASVAVLINAHTALMYKKTSNDIVSINLYLRAIKMLQNCLEDSREGMSTNTLCASVLLGLVEVGGSNPLQPPRADLSTGTGRAPQGQPLLSPRWWGWPTDGITRSKAIP